jgi:phosphate starvation-inducible PhoH-like protein
MNAEQRAAIFGYADENPAPRKARKLKEKAARSDRFENLSLRDFSPMTEGQSQMMRSFKEDFNIVATGSAGVGKTAVSVYLALEKLFAGDIDRIIIVRSAVATRDMGFLPGNLEEKSDPYKAPYKQTINQLCGSGTAWDTLTKKGFVDFITSSYVRGITVENCVLIVDEYVSMTWNELNAIVTRLGKNTQLFLLGDSKQCDLKNNRDSCYTRSLEVTKKMTDWFDVVEFFPSDIVRSDFVKSWIINTEE